MVVEHIVLFKWSEAATAEQIEAAIRELRALKDNVPGIVDLTVGENFSTRAQGFTHGLVVRFESKEGLDAYGPHPNHQRVVENFISPIRQDTLALDYEF